MSIQNENDVTTIDSTKEDSINNLFGLTSEVETEIKFCIKNNHKKDFCFSLICYIQLIKQTCWKGFQKINLIIV